MEEDEITALKKALCDQLLVMQRLYTELEDEREASASGADEALTMILRLQKEKAEEKMEACQYKQMAEAKMHHAEESLAVLEKVICQKDIEITSLKHQVQTCTQMLQSSGVNNVDIRKRNENRWCSSNAFLARTSSCIQFKRQNSMPSIRFSKLRSEIAINERDGSLLPALQSIWREIGDNQNQLKEHRRQCVSEKPLVKESNSDVNQLQDVSTSVKRLLQTQSVEQKTGSRTMSANNQFQINMTTGPQSFEEDFTPCSWYSAAGSDMLSSSCLEAESIGNTIQYVSTQHMLEIPKSNSGCLLRKSSKKGMQEHHLEAEHMSGIIPESTQEETALYSLDDDDFSKKALNLPNLRKGTSMNYGPNFIEPRVQDVSFQSDMEQLKCQVQQLADDVSIMKAEGLKKGREQLKLLRKIHEQLKPVQSQTKNSKSFPQDEVFYVSLTEAMLSFSL